MPARSMQACMHASSNDRTTKNRMNEINRLIPGPWHIRLLRQCIIASRNDALFKSAFEHPERAAGLLQSVLPPTLTRRGPSQRPSRRADQTARARVRPGTSPAPSSHGDRKPRRARYLGRASASGYDPRRSVRRVVATARDHCRRREPDLHELGLSSPAVSRLVSPTAAAPPRGARRSSPPSPPGAAIARARRPCESITSIASRCAHSAAAGWTIGPHRSYTGRS